MAYEEFKLGHAKASIYHADNGNMELHSLRVPNKYRKTGEAHKMMQHLTSIADEKGKKMKLISSPLDKKTHATKLYNFYRKHGFEHTGALIGGMPVMERRPVGNTVTSAASRARLRKLSREWEATKREGTTRSPLFDFKKPEESAKEVELKEPSLPKKTPSDYVKEYRANNKEKVQKYAREYAAKKRAAKKAAITSSDLAHIPLFAYLYEDANEDSGNRYSEMETPGMTSQGAYVARNPDNKMRDHDDDLTKINFEENKQYLRDHDAPIDNFNPAEMPYDNSMPSNIKEGDYSPGFNFKSPAKWHSTTNTPIFSSKKKVKAELTPEDLNYMLENDNEDLRHIARYYIQHKVESKAKVTKEELEEMLQSDDKHIRQIAKAYIKNLKG